MLWFSLPLFEYHYRQRHKSDSANEQDWAITHQHFQRALEDIIAETMTEDRRNGRSVSLPPGLLARYIASSFVLVFRWWQVRPTLAAMR